MNYQPVIGLEIHAELATQTKMFCACRVVDSTTAEPNTSVCPVCAGMPGALPVANARAIEYAVRVALALECEVAGVSIFARKNYFYPDLPKGYQISQYEQPLARHGRLVIVASQGERTIRIRRAHIEEDAGKLTHVEGNPPYTLVDLNRAGVPLLEIVSEPDLHSAEEVRAYATALRNVLRYLGVNSGDLQKGVLRIEPNISLRPVGSQELGTRTEIKNLNSFRALERGVAYEIERQTRLLERGERVQQETRGWDEARGVTFAQRSKEEAEDYRYFPEPDLPPVLVSAALLEQARRALPELPAARLQRFQSQYGLNAYDAGLLVEERAVADYFEAVTAAGPQLSPKQAANWVTGELFALLNQAGQGISQLKIPPSELAALLELVARQEINQPTAKTVLAEMFAGGGRALEVVERRGLRQVSDQEHIAALVRQVLADNPEPVQSFLGGKAGLARWLFGQVMRAAGGKANPQVLQAELDRQLAALPRGAE